MENTIETLTKQKTYLQTMCRKAGAEIRELKDTVGKLEKLCAITTDDVVDRLRDADSRTIDYTEGK